MKAYCLPGPGAAPVLMEVDTPAIDAHDVLIGMRAIGVGIHDRYTHPATVSYPYPIGLEGAGLVVAVGDAVSTFAIGDRVMTSGIHPKGGTWAAFAAIDARMVMPIPEKLGFPEAAALPVAGTTALEGIKALQLTSGNTLFIAGASGAIGTLAIQMARHRGYRVAASASPGNHPYLMSLGAEVTVDYTDPHWADQIRQWVPVGLDAALAIQRGTGQTSLDAVRNGGRVVTISGDQVHTERDIVVEQMMHSADTRAEFLEIAADIAAGNMRVVIEQSFPFNQALAALAKTETGHARGKIVITVDENEPALQSHATERGQ